MTYAEHIKNKETPQSEPLFGREEQMAKNDAGGYVFRLSHWGQLERFLVLGSEGGTYYVSPQKHSARNIKSVLSCLKEDGKRVVDMTVSISESGVAPKNDPALFVMALAMTPAYANASTRAYAASKLPAVARIGTHLFTFVSEVDQLRGWGKLLRQAVGNWYTSKEVNQLAYQVTKYQQRGGWSHRDLLRLAHPEVSSYKLASVFDYVTHGYDGISQRSTRYLPELVHGIEMIKSTTDVSEAVKLIRKHRLTHEMVPNDLKKNVKVWDAMLQNMPINATIRNLATMTSRGLLTPTSEATQLVVSRLDNGEILSKARVHPISILSAWNTYRRGKGFRGSQSWEPVQPITNALERAFYTSFGFIPSTGKRILLALDISGSMGWPVLHEYGLNMTPREVTAVMAMVTAKREPMYNAMAFTSGKYNAGNIARLEYRLNAHDSLETTISRMAQMPFGGTDCALPMIYASKRNLEVDVIVIYTDDETWAGDIHPAVALNQYRQKTGLATKLIVVATTSTGFSIADPDDPYMLDIVGFDTRVPKLIADFTSA